MKTIKAHKFIATCIVLAVIVSTLILCAILRTTDEDRDEQAKAIQETISERALQCYVIEDAYPESLAYLEENYGLAVNKKDFKIIYTPYAENLPPDVKVIYRGDE